MNTFKQNWIQIVILILLVSNTSQAQNIGDWRVYSSFTTINNIAVKNADKFYAATQGGLVSVENQIIQNRYTTIEGLYRLDGKKSVYDAENNQIIIAYPDGVIDLFNVENDNVQRITDIQRVTEFTSKSINDIELYNGLVYTATDFGIVVFNATDFFVVNSFLNLGDFPRGTSVNGISIREDSIFVATENGIAFAFLEDNLVSSDNWDNAYLDGTLDNEVDDLAATTRGIFAIKNDSAFYNDQNSWIALNSSLARNANSIKSVGNEVFVATSTRIISIDENLDIQVLFELANSSILTFEIFENKLFVGTREFGVIEVDLSTFEEVYYTPSGPYLNFFSELEFSDERLIASATDQFPSSDPFNPIRGYYIYENNEWKNFNRNTNSILKDFNYATAYTVDVTNDQFFVGSWGDGVAVHNNETDEIEVFDNSNSGFSGISANRSFVVISGLDSDANNNTWAISFISNLPLNVYSPENNEWFHFESLPIPSDELYFRLFADSKNKLWISLIDIENNGEGLLVIDTGNDPYSDADDTFKKLTTGENTGNLPDNNVIAIAEDRNGEVWIGTTRGIARFIFPDFIVESNNPSEFTAQWLINSDTSATSRFLLRDINVSSIAVNSANQKWIGSTNQGLWLLNEDGSQILERFTAENSPLLSNNIQDIAINDESGEVFVSTNLGLVSFIETSKVSATKLDDLKVYPNPFIYDTHDEIIIDGLTDETSVKILGADGSVFSDFNTRGGRVVWSGLDAYGNKLASGVYFVVAIDENGSEKGIGKVVIIR